MNTMLLTTAILALVGVASVYLGARFLREDDLSGWGLIFAGVAFVTILCAIMIPAFTYGGRAYGRVECRNWGHQTGRPVKFAVYTSWDNGSCLTRDDHGKWVSKDQLRVFASGS